MGKPSQRIALVKAWNSCTVEVSHHINLSVGEEARMQWEGQPQRSPIMNCSMARTRKGHDPSETGCNGRTSRLTSFRDCVELRSLFQIRRTDEITFGVVEDRYPIA